MQKRFYESDSSIGLFQILKNFPVTVFKTFLKRSFSVCFDMFLFFSLILFSISWTSIAAKSLKQLLLADNEEYEDAKIILCKDIPDLFITILIRSSPPKQGDIPEQDYWETLKVVRYKKNKIISNVLFFDSENLNSRESITFTEIHSARQLRLPGFTNPLLEVLGSRDGNHFYYLYEIENNKAKLLLETQTDDLGRFLSSIGKKDNLDRLVFHTRDCGKPFCLSLSDVRVKMTRFPREVRRVSDQSENTAVHRSFTEPERKKTIKLEYSKGSNGALRIEAKSATLRLKKKTLSQRHARKKISRFTF
ncbi:hypothetical protein LEP1GSC198_3280 [Leptospira kirschneri str. JB]|uniref:hypothetical protein n=1 Tax=Leptospira kirschneri TaxID=29507 RepID=UPI0002BE2DEE|nr:hypothetical protein [Leptospira kirschneri]EMJ94008.1 hypothetical protein LEP1GSC198_3280 [Leptospira kirschneri str. JB]